MILHEINPLFFWLLLILHELILNT